MGLDIRVSRIDRDGPHARWAYSGFMHFRERLAREIGVDLRTMEGFGGDRSWDEIDDPIVPLLNHSDCDGDLDYEACARIDGRLLELVKDWPADDYDKQQALELAHMVGQVTEGEAEQVVFG